MIYFSLKPIIFGQKPLHIRLKRIKLFCLCQTTVVVVVVVVVVVAVRIPYMTMF